MLALCWEFPKIRGTLFWVPYKKDPTISGTLFGSPIFGRSLLSRRMQQAASSLDAPRPDWKALRMKGVCATLAGLYPAGLESAGCSDTLQLRKCGKQQLGRAPKP